jgi:hypothetical protein
VARAQLCRSSIRCLAELGDGGLPSFCNTIGTKLTPRIRKGPLFRLERTKSSCCLMSALDPGCVKTSTNRECAELFSLFSYFDGDCQSRSFVIQRNRDKLSTRKFGVGVFTQPGPLAGIPASRLRNRASLSLKIAPSKRQKGQPCCAPQQDLQLADHSLGTQSRRVRPER